MSTQYMSSKFKYTTICDFPNNISIILFWDIRYKYWHFLRKIMYFYILYEIEARCA